VASRASKRLVIDASVARAAGGEEATFPTSKYCRDLLTVTLTTCHRVVMTQAIREEWNEHQSNFARRWRVSMEARKKVHREEDPARDELREKVKEAVAADKDRDAILKDIHLVEAALRTDLIVISLDDRVRGLLSGVSRTVGELRRLLWANPAIGAEDAIAWLGKGAKAEKGRELGTWDPEGR
jgi:hypothetical protein